MPTWEYQLKQACKAQERKELEKRTKRTKQHGDFTIIYR
jgi:hypothetical protein